MFASSLLDWVLWVVIMLLGIHGLNMWVRVRILEKRLAKVGVPELPESEI